VLPSPLAGTLEGVEKGERVIVALNGRVAGIGRAYAAEGDPVVRFSVLVAPAAFRPGRNDVRIFAARADGALRPPYRELDTGRSG
jgi:hypothetical protein